MRRSRLLLLVLAGLALLGETPLASPASESSADHMRLRLVRIIDPGGFGQQMEAASILLPSDWEVVESGVRWETAMGCPQNAPQLSLRARSPDGRLGFEVFPDYSWEWSDDPAVLQYAWQAAQQYGVRGCDLLPPHDAVGYLQHVFLPRWRAGFTLVDLGRVTELVEAMQIEWRAFTGGDQSGVRTDFDVALATVDTGQGDGASSEWILASIIRTTGAMPAVSSIGTGMLQMAASYKTAALSQFAARAPQGELVRHEKLFESIWRSFRLNPRWDAARLQFLQTIAQIQRKGAQDRHAIMEKSRREIGAIIDQVDEARQSSLDRRFERQSQALRGVESYGDPDTDARVELSTGYQGAWTNGLGDYLLSDSPGFDPGRELGGNWRALRRE